MLPRTKSIFHLGDEGGEAHSSNMPKTTVIVPVPVPVRPAAGVPSADRCFKLRAPRVLEGLRILIQQGEEEDAGQRGGRSHVVIKSSLIRSTAHRRPSPKTSPELGVFLKTCSLCKKELSPHKDVYMYRGDQGYCSEECRCRQILLDERREFKASAPREPSHGYRRRTTGSKIRASTPQNGRILVAA